MEFDLNLILTSCVTILLGYLTYYTVKIIQLRHKYKHIPGPPTNGILGFYLGNSIDIFTAIKYDNKIMMQKISEWVEKYGTTIKFQFMNRIVVHTIDLQANREILIENNFPKLPEIYHNVAYPYGSRFIGRGILTDEDPSRWKHRRGLFNPAFHKQILTSFMDDYNTKGDLLLEKIRSMADGKTQVVLLDEFNHAALDVIATIAFGMESNTISNPNNDLNKSITEALKGLFKYSSSKAIGFDLTGFTDRNYKKKFLKITEKLRKLGRDQIESRLKSLAEGSYVPNDILTITLRGYENEAFDIDDMIDDFITFFIAGQETSANTLSFCFLELARNPVSVKNLREEIDKVVGSRSSLNYDDLAQLQYTGCVIKETLRKWPVVPDLNRVLCKDYQINSFLIPKGTWVQTSSYTCGRHGEYFDEPELFKPERFLNEKNNDSVKTYSYFPFSLGPRNCIGQNFAMIEMKMLVVKLIKNFDFELVPGQNLNPVQYLTLRPIDGTKCFVSPRKNEN